MIIILTPAALQIMTSLDNLDLAGTLTFIREQHTLVVSFIPIDLERVGFTLPANVWRLWKGRLALVSGMSGARSPHPMSPSVKNVGYQPKGPI